MFTRIHFSLLFGCLGAVIGYFATLQEFPLQPNMGELILLYESIGFMSGAGVGWLLYREAFSSFRRMRGKFTCLSPSDTFSLFVAACRIY